MALRGLNIGRVSGLGATVVAADEETMAAMGEACCSGGTGREKFAAPCERRCLGRRRFRDDTQCRDVLGSQEEGADGIVGGGGLPGLESVADAVRGPDQ